MVKKKMKLKSAESSKKTTEEANPFDFKINRKKHDIIGQRNSRSGVISKNRTKMCQKRKEFLKKVHLHKNKANKFIDKRIGENDSEMLHEDRIMARLAESQRKKRKKSLYNLNDEFDLTHDGQPISSLETFNDLKDDSDEDDETQLDAEFVSDAHFGGFLKKKQNAPKTHKEILNEFIVDSKMKKQERREEKELTYDLTSKLDEEWKQIHSLIPNIKMDNVTKKTPCDPFDMVVNELKFESRGNPVASTKNLEIENEKKRVKLEEERLLRMSSGNKKKYESISADALDENFILFDNTDCEMNESAHSEDEMDDDKNSIENSDNVNDAVNYTDSESDSDVSNLSSDKANDNSCKTINVHSTQVPQTYENLANLISNLNVEELSLKLDSLISNCRFKADTKDLQISLKFFKCLLEYIDIKFQLEKIDNTTLDVFASCLLILVQKSPLETGKIFKDFLLEKISQFQELKLKKKFNCFSTLIILKLCGYLYSTSDFRHPIVTLAITLMSDMLSSCFNVTYTTILHRLFVCHIIYEYVFYSKRYVPEAVNYLFSLLILGSAKENSISNLIKKLNLHTSISKNILYVSSNVENWELTEFSQLLFQYPGHNFDKTNTLSVVYYAVQLLQKFSSLYKDVLTFPELFHSSINISSFLPIEYYPPKLTEKIKETQSSISHIGEAKKSLTFPNKKPKVPKLFTPRFEDYCDKKPTGIQQKFKMHKELSKKIKKEEKGIIRDIRRNAEFEAKERLKGRMEADSERKRKVKELYSELASQERDFKNVSKRK